jgi:transitional endoplasmic reticulum ATPase
MATRSKSADHNLSPSQREAYNGLKQGLRAGSILYLWGGTGRGKTTLLKALQEETGGAYIDLRDFIAEQDGKHPLELEESFARLLQKRFARHKLILFDDVHLLDLGQSCHFYPRGKYFNALMMALVADIVNRGRKIVFSTTQHLADSARERAYSFGIPKFTAADYEWLVKRWLAEGAAQLDFRKIHRFATKLNAHQLKAACDWLKSAEKIDTDKFIEYLRAQRLASNVDLEEVQNVDLSTLKCVDEVLRSLEINVALPLENDELASRYKLKSKRGILLYGPPGTGKTTIGRALAHRLRGKFFLIDGTFISGTDDFYTRVRQIFEAAKDNSPSVIFIDDADAIFEDGEERGLYRYLLTMLDGLESESSSRICVMMTAMNVAHLPGALVRSGRVELWLEMKLPSPEARRAILSEHLAELPPEFRIDDLDSLVTSTEGFTGADLKRMVQDATAIFAYENVREKNNHPPITFFHQAIQTVRQNKERYAEALAHAVPGKPRDPFGFAAMAAQAAANEDK